MNFERRGLVYSFTRIEEATQLVLGFNRCGETLPALTTLPE
jgi:hypothetical protein